MNAPSAQVIASDSQQALVRQHLIDPELCLGCGSCEVVCSAGAIEMAGFSFIIDPFKCDNGHHCLEVCSSDAIRSWRMVPANQPYSLEDQASWEQLPPEIEVEGRTVEVLLDEEEVPEGHPAPASAGVPKTFLYTQQQPLVATVKSNTRVTATDTATDIRHIVLDFGGCDFQWLEGQNIGVLPPGKAPDGHAHHMRAYSVASERDGETPGGRAMALTVKRVIDEWDGKPYFGVASNFMCDLEPGDSVRCVGPIGAHFLMPEDPACRIMMIGTGTGIAPMRAFIQRQQRVNPAPENPLQLFYGGRTPDEMAYYAELLALPESLVATHIALSRSPFHPKRYVQQLMMDRAELIGDFLQDKNSYIFICGLIAMEQGVMEALQHVAELYDLDWQRLHHDLLHEGRLQIETY